jgi:hypothetical protein
MRYVLRYVKGRVNGRDRWADSRAGGYAGRTEVCQGERSRPIPVVTIENIFQSPNIDSRTKKSQSLSKWSGSLTVRALGSHHLPTVGLE